MNKIAMIPIEDQHLDMVRSWRNDPKIRQFMYTQNEIKVSDHEKWFENAIKDRKRHLLIYEEQFSPLGFVNFTETGNCKVADWGFYTAPSAAPGTGRSLGHTALAYAFKDLMYHKVCGQALAFNHKSIKFHHALGFKQEGVLRDQFLSGDNFVDIFCFGLISNEFESLVLQRG